MNQEINCIIIDDELNNVNLLKKMLQKYCTDVHVIGTETDAIKGVSLIDDLKPDLVFLDIQMPKLNGFELLKKLEPINFELIFVTAFAEFAIEAFEYHAIGYITKPVLSEKLITAVKNATEYILKEKNRDNVFSLLEARMHQSEETKIPLSTLNGLIFVTKEDIMYCESSGNYTNFHTKEGKKIMVSRQLGEYDKLLNDTYFVRIHDQYLINLKYVTEYIKGRGGEIKLNDHITLPVSVHRKDIFLARFDKWLKR
jgi:two-component system LytT family response regulator